MNGGRGDRNVEPRVTLRDRRSQRVDGLRAAGIDHVRLGGRVRADLAGGRFRAFAVLVGADDGGAECRQRLGGCLADAGGRPHHQRRLAVEPQHAPAGGEAFVDRGLHQPWRPCSTRSRNFFTLVSPA
jgi:hypothetical protein